MTDGPDWQPTFDAVHKIPGSTKQHPAKKTWQDRIEEVQFQRKRNSSDVAVGLGAVDTGDDFDPWDWLHGFGETVTEHTEAIANLEEIAAAVKSTQAWVSDLDDMATVARAMVSTTGLTSTTSRPKFADVLDTQTVSGTGLRLYQGVTPVIQPEVQTGATTGHIYYSPIVVDRNGTVDKMRWIVGADLSILSIDYYEVALCVYNPATTNLEKVWGSGDIKSAEASTTALTEVAISMGIAQACTPGQILFAAHQQVAPGALQVSRRLGVAPQSNIARSVPLLDAWCYVAEAYSQGIPSSISLASLTRENRFIPWMSVSVISA